MLGSIQLAIQFTTSLGHTKLLSKLSLVFGLGFPTLFLFISLQTAGVSYRKGNICTPNHPAAISAWFVWLIIFAAVSWIIQIGAISAALVVVVRKRLAGTSQEPPSSATSTTAVISSEQRRRKLWRTGQRLLVAQWRSLLTAFIIVNVTIYFSMVFLEDVTAAQGPIVTDEVMMRNSAWIECLIASTGNKTDCLDLTSGFGLSESRTVGTFFLASVSAFHVCCLVLVDHVQSVGVLLLLPTLHRAMLEPWRDVWNASREFFQKSSTRRP